MTVKTFTPSAAQQTIFDFVENGTGNGVVTAVAGAGKTTTIQHAVMRIPTKNRWGRDTSILYLAFNKDIVEEVKTKLPANASAKTFHSLGLGALAKHFGKAIFKAIDDRKCFKIAERILTAGELEAYKSVSLQLVDLAKQAGIGYLEDDRTENWEDLVEHFDIELEADTVVDEHGRTVKVTIARAIKIAQEILKISTKELGKSIDYNDMIYGPLVLSLKLWGNDWVFVDEAQDLNPTRRAILRKALARDGRLIAVGDPCQAIYGFTGANSDSIERIKREFDAVELPLTVSYRCPQAVVRAAQEFVPYIQASDAAPVGVVRDFNDKTDKFGSTDAVICRNTAPLVALAYKLISQGVGCRILGREIGSGLVNLVKNMKAKSADDLETKIEAYRDREVEKAIAKGQETKAAGIEDRCEAILTLVRALPETKRTVTGLINQINSMFEDQAKGVLTLCTCHKAKGQEWMRVFLLGRNELMPSKFARQAWQKDQENNLIYVAYTRAKAELIFMPLPAKKEKGK